MIDHQAGILQADDGEEKADARRHGDLDRVRDRPHHRPPHTGDGQHHKEHTLDENRRQGHLPADPERADDTESEIGVEAHAGRQCDRKVGQKSHRQAGQSRRQRRRRGDILGRHASLGKDLRIDDEDVGHGEKSHHARTHLRPHAGAVLFEPEDAFEPIHGSIVATWRVGLPRAEQALTLISPRPLTPLAS